MNPTPLATVAGWAGGRLVAGNPGTPIARVCTDTRALQPGDLFVAISGDNFDGHDFVATAANIGAAAALVHRGANGTPAHFGVIGVRNTIAALQQLSSGYR